jgi:hypothetical protein
MPLEAQPTFVSEYKEIIVALIAVFGVVFSSAAIGAGGVVQYDPQKVIHKQQLNELEAGARDCFPGAFKAVLMQGLRDRTQILHFAEPICGNYLRNFLISEGWPPKTATDYVVKIADDELDLVLKEGQ